MTLDLSRCTLLFVETRAHEITTRVIDDCRSKATFGEVVVYTDKPDLIRTPDVRLIPCIDFPNKKLAGQFYYSRAMETVETDFALMLEWDAGIFDPTKWRADFFDYDYIGAPWVRPAGDHFDVGNGGFTLMSRKLGQFAVTNSRRFPVYTDWDFCRFQRPAYEAAGFIWPNAKLASYFAWELGPRNPEHFGYHGTFTWPEVLPKDEIIARAKIMIKNDYLTTKMREFLRAAPWLETEGHLTPDEMTRFHDLVPGGYKLRSNIPGMLSMQQRALMAGQRYRGLIPAKPQSGEKA